MAEPQDVGTLQAEADDHVDNDSAFGDDASVASSTTTLSQSIMKHREENGRTYHSYKDGKYVLPNDQIENDRLDLQHHVYSLMYDGKLCITEFAKDKPIHRVLDVGTGTGIWAIDFGDEHPEAKVLGVDLSPIQPPFVPPNVDFEIDDIEEPWTFSGKFDFIHSRMMTGSLQNWPKFFEQAYEFLSPGGYIEINDAIFPCKCDDTSMTEDSAIKQWFNLALSGTKQIGRPLDSAKTYKAELERVGFTDIVEVNYKWPMNRWPKDPKFKELGIWTCENLTSGLSGLSMALFTRILGMTPEEVEVYLVNVRRDMKNPKIHAYLPIVTFTARKPL
ncbi:S-adenosyl-L-methionine-dependent methyltransferase [Tricladium varicosporioides]|nr:S-adenosyl-L-methionine-dependent methyltransferase [Hymenoscyphus varicosporioides]